MTVTVSLIGLPYTNCKTQSLSGNKTDLLILIFKSETKEKSSIQEIALETSFLSLKNITDSPGINRKNRNGLVRSRESGSHKKKSSY